MMNDLKTIHAEIDALEQSAADKMNERTQLERDMSASGNISDEKLARFPILTNAVDIIRKRIGLLKENAAALERQQQFSQYETMTKAQHDHFTALASVDDELKQLEEQRQALIANRSEMETHNHAPAMQRARLRVALNEGATPDERERLRGIDRKYQVEGYS